MPTWAWFVLSAVAWVLLQLLYQLWEQRCPQCTSWATRRLGHDAMKCDTCGHEFPF